MGGSRGERKGMNGGYVVGEEENQERERKRKKYGRSLQEVPGRQHCL
jgi:hypothetical protein